MQFFFVALTFSLWCQAGGHSSSVRFPRDTLGIDTTLAGEEMKADWDSVWSQHIDTAEQLQGSLCSQRCTGTKVVNYVDGSRCLQCFPCTCDEYCNLYGTCCPNVDDEFWQPPPTERADCKMADNKWFLRVKTCDPAYPYNETRSLCELKLKPRRRDTVLPVTVNETGVTYANTHCAQCNHDFSQVVQWRMTCLYNQYTYNVTTDTQYDDHAILLPELCNAVPGPSNIWGKHETCLLSNSFYMATNITSICNVTGRWEKATEHVRRACEESDWSRGTIVVVDNTSIYTNIFCAMCNEAPGKMTPTCNSLARWGPSPRMTQTQLVLPPATEYSYTTLEIKACPKDQWKHPEDGCKKLRCTAGKLPGPGNSCVTPVDRVRGLGYHLHVLLEPVLLVSRHVNVPKTSPTPPTSVTSTMFTATTTGPTSTVLTSTNTGPQTLTSTSTATSTVFTATTTGLTPPTLATSTTMPHPMTGTSESRTERRTDCNYGAILKRTLDGLLAHPNSSSDPIYDDMKTTITISQTQSEDCFNEEFQSWMAKLMNNGNVTRHFVNTERRELEIGENTLSSAWFLAAAAEVDITAKTQDTRDSFERYVIEEIFLHDWIFEIDKWTVKLRAVDLTSGFHVGYEEPGFIRGVKGVQNHFPYKKQKPLHGFEHLFLPLSGRLICQHLSFYGDEFEVKVSDGESEVSFPFFLDSDLNPVSFDARSYPNEVWLEGKEQLVMCFKTYHNIFPKNVTVVNPGKMASLARYIISNICSSISVLCLLATFLTYCLFSELRYLPGLNNMGLCITLAAANLILLIPWLRSTGHKLVCVVVGVVTHWLWLMAVLWMAVGCIHMVRVFFSKTRQALNQRETKTAFLRNVLFTVLVSAGIIVLTMVICASVSGGSSIGYGGTVCYLDTTRHQFLFLAFMLPVGLVAITNLICFHVTVIAIMRVRRLQAQTTSGRRDILVYAKLATVTGAAWVLTVLAENVGQEWLLMVAEICTATQGLLLFLSYVCNGRVWRLYRARFRCLGQPSPTSTSATSVTTSSSRKAPQVEA